MRTMIEKPGIYLDVPANEYFADPCPVPSLTQSISKLLVDRAPAHARLAHPQLNPAGVVTDYSYDKGLAIGNAAHKILLGRGKKVFIIEATDFSHGKKGEDGKNDAQRTRDKAIDDGYVPILAKHWAIARELADAIHKQLVAAGLERAFGLRCGNTEVVIAWEERGIWFRSMIDWIDNQLPVCMDLKTSGLSAAPHAVPATMSAAGWHLQAAFHERGLDALDPDFRGRRKFLFVMVEQEPPYALTVHEMTEAALTIGRKQVEYAARIWRHCIETGQWPAYPATVYHTDLPGYAEAKWLEREVAEEETRQERRKMLVDLAGG